MQIKRALVDGHPRQALELMGWDWEETVKDLIKEKEGEAKKKLDKRPSRGKDCEGCKYNKGEWHKVCEYCRRNGMCSTDEFEQEMKDVN